jgi:hypothetical protein
LHQAFFFDDCFAGLPLSNIFSNTVLAILPLMVLSEIRSINSRRCGALMGDSVNAYAELIEPREELHRHPVTR